MTANRVTTAITKANGWVDSVEAVIREYVNLDQMHATLRSARFAAAKENSSHTRFRSTDEAERVIEKSVDIFYAIIEGSRADFICDEYFNSPSDISEEQETLNEADNALVEAGVTSVKVAIDTVIEKMNAEDQAR